MNDETLKCELTRLRSLQTTARQERVFGGFSTAEAIEYEKRADRIHNLETELQTGADLERSLRLGGTAAADQRREWNKSAETDTPQSAAHQSYGSRERDSSNAFNDSKTRRGSKPSNDSRKDGE